MYNKRIKQATTYSCKGVCLYNTYTVILPSNLQDSGNKKPDRVKSSCPAHIFIFGIYFLYSNPILYNINE